MSQPRVWFITGASSGFGRNITEYLLSIGDKVVATLRTPSALDDLAAKWSKSQLLVVKLDVVKLSDITSAFEQAKKVFGRVDVVFNNAGYGVFGEIEGVIEKDVRAMFDVNFWGAGNVNREAVKFFREENPAGAGGILVVNSSMVGVAAAPALGYYSATKFALEAITEALAAEIDPAWNIKVTIVEPGSYNTNAKNAVAWSPLPPAYAANTALPNHGVRAWLGDPNAKWTGDPEKAVKRMVEFVSAKGKGDTELPFRVALGKDSIAHMQPKVQSLVVDLQRSETWSENLTFDEN